MKLALITGANTGIGAATALQFALNGYSIILHYFKNPASARAVLAEIRKTSQGIIVKGDITKKATHKKLYRAAQKLGGLDVLVNNAGIMLRKDASKVQRADWNAVFAVNTIAPFELTRTLLPLLKKAKGVVVNVASIRATHPHPDNIPYGASKAALVNWTKAAAQAFAPLRVSTVSPGPTNTAMQQGRHCTEKLATPEQIARLILRAAQSKSTGKNFTH